MLEDDSQVRELLIELEKSWKEFLFSVQLIDVLLNAVGHFTMEVEGHVMLLHSLENRVKVFQGRDTGCGIGGDTLKKKKSKSEFSCWRERGWLTLGIHLHTSDASSGSLSNNLRCDRGVKLPSVSTMLEPARPRKRKHI